MTTDNHEICMFFFTKIEEKGDSQKYKCSCGKVRTIQKGTGYSNLISHLKADHTKDPDQNYLKIYEEYVAANPKTKKPPPGSVFLTNPKVVLLHSWLDWIVSDNLPICTVEKDTFRKYSRLANISVDSFSKYLYLVEAEVDENLKEELPKKFGIVIDGWSEGTTHYYGVYASYSKNGKAITRFLTIAPPIDETNFTAENQAAFIVDLVELYQRSKLDILFIVADNTATNPATAEILNVPFVGCASHRFNLAVEKYLQEFESIIQTVNKIMQLLSNLKMAGKLRRLTHLEPIKMNSTRWSSKYNMVERYFRLEEQVH
jgi:hypothetical protein